MNTILFFAHLKESLGIDRLKYAASGLTIHELKHALALQDDKFRLLNDKTDLFAAINQSIVSDDALIAEEDEIAFFPPVTGG